MAAALRRLARLRSSMRRQAQAALASAERNVQRAESSIEASQRKVIEEAALGRADGALSHLCDEFAQAAAGALANGVRERDLCSEKMRERSVENRQAEILLERADARTRKETERREQRAIDEWNQTRRRSR